MGIELMIGDFNQQDGVHLSEDGEVEGEAQG
jgi:hypothetical protein